MSQSKLARESGVSRFKICSFELGARSLTTHELESIRRTLQAEAERLRSVSVDFTFNEPRYPTGETTHV